MVDRAWAAGVLANVTCDTQPAMNGRVPTWPTRRRRGSNRLAIDMLGSVRGVRGSGTLYLITWGVEGVIDHRTCVLHPLPQIIRRSPDWETLLVQTMTKKSAEPLLVRTTPHSCMEDPLGIITIHSDLVRHD